MATSTETFLSTLSLRRATRRPDNHQQRHHISIHALLAESDYYRNPHHDRFQISIHALLAESDCLAVTTTPRTDDFYPRSPCGERPQAILVNVVLLPISIHALLAESDLIQAMPHLTARLFLSTLSLRRATQCRTFANGMYGFLSTLSLRRATWPYQRHFASDENFYPRSPCGERHTQMRGGRTFRHFYPRSPCGERPLRSPRIALMVGFLSTLSLRRATAHCFDGREPSGISIHALLAESDCNNPQIGRLPNLYFYPRSPCGERPSKGSSAFYDVDISIHALLAESDSNRADGSIGIINFYPRSPCGERRVSKIQSRFSS